MEETRSAVRHKTVSRTLLVCLLILAAVLRFYNLEGRGIYDYDEAWFLLEAKTLYDTGQFAWRMATGATEYRELRDFLKERGTVPITSGKPGYTLLVLLSFLLLGVHDYASFAVSAILGTLTVYLIYRIATRIYDARVGLLSGLVFALSPLLVGYSRCGYVQASALFFVALGFYLWLISLGISRPVSVTLFAAGCAVGYAFTCHFNLFIIPSLFIAWEIYIAPGRNNRLSRISDRLKRVMVLCIGMLVPLLFFELPGRLARMLGLLPDDQMTYLDQLLYRGHRDTHITLTKIPGIVEKLITSEGPLIAIGIVLGILILGLRFRKTGNMLLLSFLILPAIPWTFLSLDNLPPLFRNFAVLGIPASIVAGVAFVRAGELFERRFLPARHLVFPALLALVFANGVYHVRGLLPVRSAYAQATDEWVDYIRQNGGRLAFLPGSVWPIWYFYLSARYDDLPADVRRLVQFYPGAKDAMPPQGDFDAFDFKRYYRSLSNHQPELMAYFNRIRDTYRPIVRILNPVSDLPVAYSEVGGDGERKIREALSRIEPSKYIEIYDLRLRREHPL